MEWLGGRQVRKIVWAALVAIALSGIPAPVAAATSSPAPSKRAKGPKLKPYKVGKYKLHKYKVKKLGKRQRISVKPSTTVSPTPSSRPGQDPALGKASE